METTIKIFLLSKRGGLIRLIDSHLKGHLSVIIHACMVATISDSINIIPDLHYPKYLSAFSHVGRPYPSNRARMLCCNIMLYNCCRQFTAIFTSQYCSIQWVAVTCKCIKAVTKLSYVSLATQFYKNIMQSPVDLHSRPNVSPYCL